jgi:acyl-CoA thioester hydrolase
MKTPVKYHHRIVVKASDLDELKHVNNVVYFTYLQEAAIAHWYSTADPAIAEAIRWVVKRHEIDYVKAAFENDELVVTTWVNDFTGVTSDRFYEIHRGNDLIVSARTVWVALDAVTMRPKRLPQEASIPFFE